MKIVQTPNPVLTQKAKPVNKVDKKILSVINDMKKTLVETDNPKGVGLAAPQIGLSLQLFIVRPLIKSPVRTFINPEIIWKSEETGEIQRPENGKSKQKKLEGCLSIRNVWGHLERSKKVKLRYTNETGKSHEELFEGFMATIIQHEVDHLNGILFPTRVLEQKQKLFSIETDDNGEERLEEIYL